MEIPKAIIMERVRTESGLEKANEADREFPEKVDPEEHADLLTRLILIWTKSGRTSAASHRP